MNHAVNYLRIIKRINTYSVVKVLYIKGSSTRFSLVGPTKLKDQYIYQQTDIVK